MWIIIATLGNYGAKVNKLCLLQLPLFQLFTSMNLCHFLAWKLSVHSHYPNIFQPWMELYADQAAVFCQHFCGPNFLPILQNKTTLRKIPSLKQIKFIMSNSKFFYFFICHLLILSVPFSLMQNDLFYSLCFYAYLYISFMQLYIYLSVFFYTMNYLRGWALSYFVS